jgi:hypothetical protein
MKKIKRYIGIITAGFLAIRSSISLILSVIDYAPLGKILGLITFLLPVLSLGLYIWSLILKNSRLAHKAFWCSISTLAFCNIFWNGLFAYQAYINRGLSATRTLILQWSLPFIFFGSIIFVLLLLGYYSLLDEENPILTIRCPNCKKTYKEEQSIIDSGLTICPKCKTEIEIEN